MRLRRTLWEAHRFPSHKMHHFFRKAAACSSSNGWSRGQLVVGKLLINCCRPISRADLRAVRAHACGLFQHARLLLALRFFFVHALLLPLRRSWPRQYALLRFRFWWWCFTSSSFRSGPLPLFTEALLFFSAATAPSQRDKFFGRRLIIIDGLAIYRPAVLEGVPDLFLLGARALRGHRRCDGVLVLEVCAVLF